jgi:hypothetical protein
MKIDHDIGWWYWLITAPLLLVGLTGWSIGFVFAMILTIIQAFHFVWRDSGKSASWRAWGGWVKSAPAAFPVQVRIGYLGLLILGLSDPLSWIHWLQLLGTSVRVSVGYCVLARTVSLLPWNRSEPWSIDLLRWTYLSLRGPSCSTRKEEGWGIPTLSISQ